MMTALGVLRASLANPSIWSPYKPMDLHEIRANMARCLSALDHLIAGQTPPSGRPVDPNRYRVRPGGPLSDEGIIEMERRFAAGESDTAIALALSVSIDGTARRRAMWRRKLAAKQPVPTPPIK